MALLTVQEASANGALNPTVFTAADAGLADEFPNDGRTLLYVRNTNASTRDITVTPTGDLGDLTTETGAANTVPAISGSDPGFMTLGPFDVDKYSAADGNVDIATTVDTGVSYAAVRLPRRV